MSSTIVFDILARDRASDKFDKVGDSAARSSGKLKKFAAVGGAAFAAAAGFAVKFGADAVGAASDLSETLNKSSVVFGRHSSKVQAWADEASTALGMSESSALAAAAQFGDLFSQLGATQSEAAKTSTDIVKLATDLGSFHNLETSDVLDKISGALRGEYDSIQKIVPALSDARVKQEALAASGKKSVDQLTEQDKATAALALITKDSKNAFNDFAETSDGLANRQKILRATFDDMKASVGDKLLPVVNKFAGFLLNQGVPAVQKFGDWFQQKILPPLRQFAQDYAPKAREVMDKIKQAFADAEPFMKLVGAALTNVVLPGLRWLAGRSLEQAGNTIKGMGKALEAVGKAGIWMWNNALQPAFKFLANGVATVLDGFKSMLSAMSNVPGFGWAKDAAAAMGKAAEKARAVADGLNKIKDKRVTVTVAYKYEGRKNGVGSTRSDDPLDPDSYLGRGKLVPTIQSTTAKFFDALAAGIKKGGDKLDKVLVASRDGLRDKLAGIRDDMASLSDSVSSSLLGGIDFGGTLQEHLASLTGTNGALSNLMAVFQNLKDGASKNYLQQVMQSGNVGLATALANDPSALAQASSLYDANAAMAKGLGDQTAQQVLGDRFAVELEKQIKKLLDEMRGAPSETAKKLRRELADLRLVVEGLSAGQRAHLRGAH